MDLQNNLRHYLGSNVTPARMRHCEPPCPRSENAMTQEMPSEPEGEATGIASALIKARNELGLTQAQLSEISGVSRSAIKGYETGRNMPGARELKALSHILRVSPTELLFGSEQAFHDRFKQVAARGGDLDIGRARWRLHAITKLLTLDEVAALSQLARSIAVARHGIERVNSAARVGDATGMTVAMGDSLSDTFQQIDSFVAALDAEANQDAPKPKPKPKASRK